MTKMTMRIASLLILVVAACGDDAATGTSAATTTASSTTTTASSTTTTASSTTTTASSTTTTASSTTTTAVTATTTQLPGLDADGRIAQATVVQQFLFDTIVLWGEAALDTEALAEGIRSVYPIDVRGGAVDADAEGISIYTNSIHSKDVVGPENPYVVAFAVVDTTGACVGGIVFGYPTPDTPRDILMIEGAPCQAGLVYETVGMLFDLGLLDF